MALNREEKRLGSLHLLAHVRRLLEFVKGKRNWLLVFMVVAMLQAAAELALPLIVRGAIDQYIALPWVVVEKEKSGDLLAGFHGSMEDGPGKDVFIRRAQLGRTRLRALAAKGALKATGWVRTRDGSWLSEGDIGRLDPERRKFIRADSLEGVRTLAFVYAGLLLVIFVLAYGGTFGLGRIGQIAVLNMRLALWKKMLRLPVRYFDENPVGRLVTRVANDPANLSELFSSVLATAISDLVQFVGILGLFFWLDALTTVWLLALIPVLMALIWWFKRISQKIYRRIRIQVAALNTFVQESFGALEVIRAFVFERRARERFDKLNLDNYQSQVSLVHVFAIFRPAVDSLSTGGLALIVWYAGGRVLFSDLSLGTFVAFVLYLKMLFRPLQNLADKFNILQSSVVSSERLMQILDEPEEPAGTFAPNLPGAVEVEFEDVRFSYEPGQLVLKGVSFLLRPGQQLAIVGPSGCGKSTILSLLLGFYELGQGQGRILIDGKDISLWDPRALRKKFALVPQDLFLFSSALRDNICLFDEKCDDRLAHAIKVARLKRVVDRLEGGIGHVLNERGTILSQGERQLVSFARAVASGRPCLLLDEATSCIDTATEELVRRAMHELLRQHTALVVAHRLSTVQNSDLILVLKNGSILQRGTHDELMAENGLYRQMYTVQQNSSP